VLSLTIIAKDKSKPKRYRVSNSRIVLILIYPFLNTILVVIGFDFDFWKFSA